MIKPPSTRDFPTTRPRRKVVFIGFCVLIATLLIYGVFEFRQRMGVARHQEQVVANQKIVKDLARQLSAELEPHKTKLKALAQKPSVVSALSADKVGRAKAALAEQSTIPAAVLLRLLPRGAIQVDLDSKPPLTFASVDMLHRAVESDKDIGVELHLSGTDNEHLVMIQRVPLRGPIVGFLHLSLNSDAIKTAIVSSAPTTGKVEVRQPVPKSAPLIVAKSGTANGDFPAVISEIDGTKWVVSYRSRGSGLETKAGLGVGITAMVMVALLGAVVFLVVFFTNRRHQLVMSTAVVYQGAIRSILEGAHPDLERILPSVFGPVPVEFESTVESSDRREVVTGCSGPRGSSGSEDIEVVEMPPVQVGVKVEPSIFRNYDIRGIVGDTLTLKGVYEIGRAIGTEAAARGQRSVITARDGRNSSRELRDALAKGLCDSGCDVFDLGSTPTPVLYFATHYLDINSGVMITGSHNPPEYNGLKIVLDGETLFGDAIQKIRTRVETQDYTTGEGVIQSTEIIPEYIKQVTKEIPPPLGNSFKVVVDCGNSVPGIVAPQILRAIGHEVIELYCDVDGNFPNHHPDPSQPENLHDLIGAVRDEDADLGLAFDGDGDRLGVVDGEGKIIWPDRQMILFARDVLSRNPGAKIIYDVKCSGVLRDEIKKHGGEPIMGQTGHSLIKKKMKETGALLAGEMSGHIFFKERWYGFDDALYAAARLLEILSTAGGSLDGVFGALPERVSTAELRLEMPEQEHAEFMQNVLAAASFDDGVVTTIDGLRVDFSDCWGLIRPSNTTPCLVLRFEGDDKAALDKIKTRFRELLTKIDRKLALPF